MDDLLELLTYECPVTGQKRTAGVYETESAKEDGHVEKFPGSYNGIQREYSNLNSYCCIILYESFLCSSG